MKNHLMGQQIAAMARSRAMTGQSLWQPGLAQSQGALQQSWLQQLRNQLRPGGQRYGLASDLPSLFGY
jgi:hypothetical protein